MRSRILDIALLVGLVVVAGGIMWTLFNLGGGPRPAPSTPVTNDALPGGDPAGNGNVVVPVTPDGDPVISDGDGGVVPIDPGDFAGGVDVDDVPGGVNGVADAAGGIDDDDVAPDPEPVAQPPAPPRILPDGTIELERVGYSYVTGGAGACGVVLEAWQHVAVSRDLLAEYGCGATVTVTLDDPAGDRTQVQAVIADTMNPSHSHTVNIYVGEDEDALSYGITTGVLTAQ